MERKNFNPLVSSSRSPLGLEIISAQGDFLFDAKGKKFLDFISGISVSNLGHRHPNINDAIKDQLEKHSFVMVFGEYHQTPQVDLAKALIQITPANLDGVYFLSTGSEANEAAIKLARRYTKKKEIISFQGSYHGSTMGSLSASGNEKRKSAFRPLLPGFAQIPFNDSHCLKRINKDTAAVLVEAIQGDAGVRIPSADFMKELRGRCTEFGCLLIIDEIQTGLGRTGKMFAFEHFDIEPDIITLGKALGGGIPLSAIIAPQNILSSFQSHPELGHISTHGGNPLGCRAGIAQLEILNGEGFLNSVDQKGEYLRAELEKLPFKEVRSKGLFFALEMNSAEEVQKMVSNCLEKGLITFWFLSNPQSFRIAPPLNIEEENLKLGIKLISEAMQDL